MNSRSELPKAAYSLQELADRAGLSRWRIERLLRSNGIQFVRSGRTKVVLLSELKLGFADFWQSILDREALR